MPQTRLARAGLIVVALALVPEMVEAQPPSEIARRKAPGKLLILPIFQFGGTGSEPGEFDNPQGIGVDPNGFVYVADTDNHRVQMFDADGHFIVDVGGFGWQQEQFNSPVEVACSNGLDVFVADRENRRIERYDKDLHYISSMSADEDVEAALSFGFPEGLALSEQGELFVVDGDANRILKFNVQGVPELAFGQQELGEFKLERPSRLAVWRAKQILVSDPAGKRIVGFDYYGNIVWIHLEEGLDEPRGVAVMGDRFLCVSDVGRHEIVIYDLETRRSLARWGGKGSKDGDFLRPADLAVWGSRLYVLDSGNDRVQVYDIREQ